jgi:transposase
LVQEVQEEDGQGGFIPLIPDTPHSGIQGPSIEVHYPNGVVLKVSATTPGGPGQAVRGTIAMFALTTSHRFLLYRKVTDFRKGFDGLCGLVHNELDREPTSGEVFVFINRTRDRIKLLHWQQGGFVLYYKRLEKGTISLPPLKVDSPSCQVSYADLVLMIEGISVEKVVKKERY